ncbi:sucrose-6-phosphate hydrolase [Frankia sp. AgB1.9]|uniref:sucrose-6-phosphate hydrolase n=1 Tax=unclassified Frankia TaxID=2632575 RepID=UPI0019339E15|nr:MULTISPECIES: sucrose-6-phosphate hydrolase [unclassified Frankia]MBL7491201.1 sucrose-6-phosphate hydrolase [Frankia sp. AgW1.1]MBL7549938.1 sucrose-6-phosphate hydrolase [Frankia sp. AgB1.9]MBL7622477.1 sucrose-6-phosphate hydrolase [Frankia sp. AgB1.8]
MTPAPAALWLVACDLDQTLIFSRRSFRLPPGVAEPELVLVERLNGEPAAFMTATAFAGVAELARRAVLVPVTTRTLDQYRRVDLGVTPPFAVAANGGHVLVDGEPDPGWAAAVAARLRDAAPLAEVLVLAERLATGGWCRLTRVADDLFVYLVAHERDGIPDLTAVTAELAAAGWTVSVQGRKVYFVPATLTKQAALAEVARRAGTDRTIAAGDSLLDAPMLAAADVAVRPAHGELHDRAWDAPNLRVTAAAGILGGAEIVGHLATVVTETMALPVSHPASQG